MHPVFVRVSVGDSTNTISPPEFKEIVLNQLTQPLKGHETNN